MFFYPQSFLRAPMTANSVGNAPIGDDDGKSFIQRLMASTWKASSSVLSIGKAQLENLLQHAYDSARSATVEEMHHEYAERVKKLERKEEELHTKEEELNNKDEDLERKQEGQNTERTALDARDTELSRKERGFGNKKADQDKREGELHTATEKLKREIAQGQREVEGLRGKERSLQGREELLKHSVQAIQIFAISPVTEEEASNGFSQSSPLILREEPFKLEEIQQMLNTKHAKIEKCRKEIGNECVRLATKDQELDRREDALKTREREQSRNVQDMDGVSHNMDDQAILFGSPVAAAMDASPQEPQQEHTTAQLLIASNRPMQPATDDRPLEQPTRASNQRKRGRAPSPEDDARRTRQRLSEESGSDFARNLTPPSDPPRISLGDQSGDVRPNARTRDGTMRANNRRRPTHRRNGMASSGPRSTISGSISRPQSNRQFNWQPSQSNLNAVDQQSQSDVNVVEQQSRPLQNLTDHRSHPNENAADEQSDSDESEAEQPPPTRSSSSPDPNRPEASAEDTTNVDNMTNSFEISTPNRHVSVAEKLRYIRDHSMDDPISLAYRAAFSNDFKLQQTVFKRFDAENDARLAEAGLADDQEASEEQMDRDRVIMPSIETEPDQDDEVTDPDGEILSQSEIGSTQDEVEEEEEEL